MKRIKTLIVDNEPKERNLLWLLLKDYCQEVQILGMADSVDIAYDLIEQHQPDLLFLNIMMPQKSGFDLLNRLPKLNMEVVLVTGFDHYALEAIKYQVLDYLLKPININELTLTVAKVKFQLSKKHKVGKTERPALDWSTNNQISNQIAIPSQDSREFIPIEQILYCRADGACTWVFLDNGRKILSTKNLGEYEKKLPSPLSPSKDRFFRIHHSYILNLSAIRKFNRREKYVELKGGYQITIAQRRSAAFLEILREMNLL